MSDFEHTSLQEELEVRVIALLTGELSETEADELEKILAIDEELSAFRDRMAGLMGQLHQSGDELAPSVAEAPRCLSEARRAKIFGDASVLEPQPNWRRFRFKAGVWAIAASFAMLFVVGLLSTLQFSQSVLLEEMAFDAPPAASEPQMESESKVNMRQQDESTSLRRRPAIVMKNTSEAEIQEQDVNADNSSGDGRGAGGFDGALSGIREMRDIEDLEGTKVVVPDDRFDRQDFAIDQVETEWSMDFDRTLPVDILAARIEGTPQSIRVPGLEPRATEAQRMVVAKEGAKPPRQRVEEKYLEFSGAFENDTEPGFDWEAGAQSLFQNPTQVKPQGSIRRRVAVSQLPEADEAIHSGTAARSGPVDFFAAPSTSGGTRENQTPANRKTEVAQLSKKGRNYFLEGDYAAAAGAFDEISNIEPGNAEAKLFASRIDSLQGQKGQVPSREEMLRQVSQSWERPKVFDINKTAGSDLVNEGLQEKLNKIVIPQVNFSGMELTRVLRTL